MSMVPVHELCSREMNGLGPSLSWETTSEICNDSEAEGPWQMPSDQACDPLVLPTKGFSVAAATAAVAPPWLLSSLADLKEKMGLMALDNPGQDDTGETFGERSESYYRKRPQLLAFLQDLYRAYVSLSDRYAQLLSKNNLAHHSRHSSQSSTVTIDNKCSTSENDHGEDLSDAESSLSFQQALQSNSSTCQQLDVDALVAEIVIKNVDCDILLHEAETSGLRSDNASRKIELQRSLLEVLEAERLMLLNENVRLGYRVDALIEENRDLAAELVFMKSKVGELAQCFLKVREEQTACRLSRKIEDLQGQIYRLERRNKDYQERLARMELEGKARKGNGGSRDLASQQHEERRLKPWKGAAVEREKKVIGWWERVKKMDMFVCGMMHTKHSCE
ncbi:hypothetical protein SAY87_026484 [Trapa incisa]|uniref:NAB domain-containing protein n=1 Tax=Trapa incisa TaxID=236973 RepID=A0AAN7JM17_9MYRT|nr:hypothetical protein SAY87_026484 [Trapa incisa]